MLKKNIKYTDYNGSERNADYYFALSKPEVVKWITSTGEYTLDKAIEAISVERNMKKIVDLLDDLIKRSYGVKSLDGNNFIKSDEEWLKFSQSPAYDVIFMELISDANKAADFFNGILPQDLANDLQRIIKENPNALPDSLKEYAKPDNITTIQ